MLALRDYQDGAIEALYAWFAANDGNPLLVLPTGAGKSVIIAAFVRRALTEYPGTRILVLTHVKELIEQNHQRLKALWPEAPAGIFSASLRRRDRFDAITFAGIQSVHAKAWELGRYDLILVDEAHLIPAKGDGMYRQFLAESRRINPAIRIIGLTATPYRLGHGLLHEGDDALFDDIAYDIGIDVLLARGHLAPLTTQPVRARLGTEGVGKRHGEFIPSQLAAVIDVDSITEACVTEICHFGQERRGWLVFCASVKHAGHVRDAIRAQGITAELITGQTPKGERERLIQAYQRGQIRALCNVDVLTTGFDAPHTDLLAFLRPTLSPGLYLQMAGRGMRTAPGKTDCLVLDFAGNINRHGPVDQVRPPKRPERRESAAAVEKVCPECEALVPAGVRYCPHCQYLFPDNGPDLDSSASSAAILAAHWEPERAVVASVRYSRHSKAGRPDSLRVEYYGGMLRLASEWVLIEHGGLPGYRARQWWDSRCTDGLPAPRTVDDALERVSALAVPQSIYLDKRGKWPEIVRHEFESEEAA